MSRAEEQIHLAIIPDGNRRWAKQHALRPWQGHKQGIDNAKKIVDFCYDHSQVAILTLWGLSTENWARSEQEISMLMKNMEIFLAKERAVFQEKNTRFVHSGRLDRLPPQLAQLIQDIVAETTNNGSFTVNLALDYGGRDDILRAVKKLTDPAAVTEATLRPLLDLANVRDIDLVVRTSGQQRTSNFFMWQAAYAEWCFIDKYFPDLSLDDLSLAIADFFARQRRFGS